MTTKKVTKETEVKEVKKVEAPKTEAPKTEVKAEAKVEAVKEVKKAPAKKAAAKKAPAKKAEKVEKAAGTVITIQYQGNEATLASVEEKVKAAYVAEGHKASSIKTLNIYVKPEEFAAYYVINEKNTGRVNLF